MKKHVLMSLILGLWLASVVNADHINVSGDVSGTWSVDTVFVFADVCVPSYETLVIEPGTIVLFNGHFKFIVDTDANLQAVGTDTDTILFDERFEGNGWHGIRFLDASDASNMDYCLVRNGLAVGDGEDAYGGGLYIWACSPTITNSVIELCKASRGAGIYFGNGSNAVIDDCLIRADSCSGAGGGIACKSSNPTISNTVLRENHSTHRGGAIHCETASPTITGNTIINNKAFNWGGGINCNDASPVIEGNIIVADSVGSEGGGIRCENNSSPEIRDNSITENYAYYNGGGLCFYGGSPEVGGNDITCNSARSAAGIYFYGCTDIAVTDNDISSNTATYQRAGGVDIRGTSGVFSSNSVIGNSANGDGGGMYYVNSNVDVSGNTLLSNQAGSRGGGIYFSSSADDTLRYNVIARNTAGSDGGAVYLDNSVTVFESNTICDNTAFTTGGIYCNASDVALRKTILYFNDTEGSMQIGLYAGSSADIECTDIENGWPGVGNIDVDPCFCDFPSGDFHITDISECAPANNSCGELIGALDVDCEGTDVEMREGTIPDRYAVRQNYPNPFNAETSIEFTVPLEARVNITVYNLLGHKVAVLVDRTMAAGRHRVKWDSREAPSGIYLYRFKAGDYEVSRKMMLVK